MTPRIKKLRSVLKSSGVDAILVSDPLNTYYMSGFRCDSACLLITQKNSLIFTDFRFREEARRIAGFELKLVDSDFGKLLAKTLKDLGAKKIGLEAENLSYTRVEYLKKGLRPAKIDPVPTIGIVENLRLIKDAHEIENIKKCVAVAKKVLGEIKNIARPGISEKRLAREIDDLIIRFGGHKNAFDTIAAFGENASRPHAVATDRTLKNNEAALIDFGVSLNYYNCDLTRMCFLGKIHRTLDYIYNICKEARELAIGKIKPGIRISDVDRAARGYIEKKGYGKSFGHALGHGIGLAVHESPHISSGNKQTLKANMVFTIEPGIYVEGAGGVRIEDVVLVTDKGCEVLTE